MTDDTKKPAGQLPTDHMGSLMEASGDDPRVAALYEDFRAGRMSAREAMEKLSGKGDDT